MKLHIRQLKDRTATPAAGSEILLENPNSGPRRNRALCREHPVAPNRICLCAHDENGDVVGIVGGLPDYDG